MNTESCEVPLDVLLIEDDRVLGGALAQRLRLEGFNTSWAETCEQALRTLRRLRTRPAVVIADIRLPDGSAEDLLRAAMPYLGDGMIIFATAFSDVAQAVRLVRAGADDYITKPYDVDALVGRVHDRLAQENRDHPIADASIRPFGQTECTRQLAYEIERLGQSTLPVLISGETGVGKEVAARAIHAQSALARGPFVAINCGSMAGELVNSQMFGHERGAFTSASSAHDGFLAEAAHGTLFLDEIGALDQRMQVALLRVVEDGAFRRLGAKADSHFNGRIMAATNVPVAKLRADGMLREDLYYRLAVAEVHVPSLRERPDDVRPLAETFLAQTATKMDLRRRQTRTLGTSAISALLRHRWPGNVRELRNRIYRAAALSMHEMLTAADLFPEKHLDHLTAPALSSKALPEARLRAEADAIERALAEADGKVGLAARELGISRTTLWKRMKQAGKGADD